MPDATIEGVVVDTDSNQSLGQPSAHDGLFLKIDDGRAIQLVCGKMNEQTAIEFMWQKSRKAFEGLLGQRVKVAGYLSRGILYGAHVVGNGGDLGR